MKAKKPQSRVKHAHVVLGLIIAAAILSVTSRAVRTSTPTYGPDGKQVSARTVVTADGHKMNFESKNYGWPVPYFLTSCWGTNNDCWPTQYIDWTLVLVNTLAWFAFVTAASAGYLHVRKVKPRRPSRKN